MIKTAAKKIAVSPFELGRDIAKQVVGIESMPQRPHGDNFIERQQQKEAEEQKIHQQILDKERNMREKLEVELAQIRHERLQAEAQRRQQEQSQTQTIVQTEAPEAQSKKKRGPMGAIGNAVKVVTGLFNRTSARAEKGKSGSG